MAKRTDFSFKGVYNDEKGVGELRRKMFGDNVFGIKPDKPSIACTQAGCSAVWNGSIWSPGCSGMCLYC